MKKLQTKKSLVDVPVDLNKIHPSHDTEMSMGASSYDEKCKNCNRTDVVPGGPGLLAQPCPNPDGSNK